MPSLTIEVRKDLNDCLELSQSMSGENVLSFVLVSCVLIVKRASLITS
mgnify:CR=1 FL=1